MSRSDLTFDNVRAGTYVAPTLRVYGDVTALTASGTGAQPENSTGPGACSNTSSRRPC